MIFHGTRLMAVRLSGYQAPLRLSPPFLMFLVLSPFYLAKKDVELRNLLPSKREGTSPYSLS